MKQSVIDIINKNHEINDGKSGISETSIMQELDVDFSNLKLVLYELAHESKIKFRKRINGRLIFKNPNHND